MINKETTAKTFFQNEEKLYMTLLMKFPEAVFLFDSTGSIFFVNSSFLNLFGFNCESEITGNSIFELLPENEYTDFQHSISDCNSNNDSKPFETVMLKKNKNRFYTEIKLLKLEFEQKSVFMCIIKDISGMVKFRNQKEKKEIQTSTAFKMEIINQLTSRISHDFNNIIGAISGYADIINQRYKKDPKLQKYTQMILSSSSKASELIDKMLTITPKKKLKLTPINTHHLLQEISGLINQTISRQIEVSYKMEANDPVICADTVQFQTILMNLVKNAIDAMPAGGKLTIKTFNTTLDKDSSKNIFEAAKGDYLVISVIDTGHGMDEFTISHLFEPFFTTRKKTKGRGGLGLTSVYGAVKSHNGFVDVKSRVHEGSVFSIYFPVIKSICKPDQDTVNKDKFSKKSKAGILVVDDESFMRDAVREMLSWIGYNVITCCDGKNALEIFKSNYKNIDLIILDMAMPEMDGMECYKLLKKIKNDIRVLLSTGYMIEDNQQSILEEGIAGIIQKPFVSQQLEDAVSVALKKCRS